MEPDPYLVLLERAASAANNSDALEDAAQIVLQEVCRITGWTDGSLRDGGHAIGEHAVGDPPGLFAFPILSGDGVVGFLEFAGPREAAPIPELLDAMAVVGRQLGRIVDRQRSATALRAELERTFAERALRDELTGLPNRALLLDRIDQALTRGTASSSSVAVLCLDLDQFKAINDQFGREAGNGLLKAVADRLGQAARAADTLARIAGDEFALLWEDLQGGSHAGERAEEVQALFQAPFDVGGELVAVSVSAGVAVAAAAENGDEGHAEMLLREANAAMYRAKKAGRSRYELFDET
ncbi:MAG: GGDEF domain-containing protein, partial [Actinomycetota bacterium]|nr:GGDEF domain-containing protein [Actinomycetota bacterium]